MKHLLATALLGVWHKLQHRFGWWGGRVESMTTPDGRILIGLMCSKCGNIYLVIDATEEIERNIRCSIFPEKTLRLFGGTP